VIVSASCCPAHVAGRSCFLRVASGQKDDGIFWSRHGDPVLQAVRAALFVEGKPEEAMRDMREPPPAARSLLIAGYSFNTRQYR